MSLLNIAQCYVEFILFTALYMRVYYVGHDTYIAKFILLTAVYKTRGLTVPSALTLGPAVLRHPLEP